MQENKIYKSLRFFMEKKIKNKQFLATKQGK